LQKKPRTKQGQEQIPALIVPYR